MWFRWQIILSRQYKVLLLRFCYIFIYYLISPWHHVTVLIAISIFFSLLALTFTSHSSLHSWILLRSYCRFLQQFSSISFYFSPNIIICKQVYMTIPSFQYFVSITQKHFECLHRTLRNSTCYFLPSRHSVIRYFSHPSVYQKSFVHSGRLPLTPPPCSSFHSLWCVACRGFSPDRRTFSSLLH